MYKKYLTFSALIRYNIVSYIFCEICMTIKKEKAIEMKKEIQLDQNGKRKFGTADKLAYAAGDFGCNMSFALKNTVQTFWIAYMFMNTKLLGWLVLATQIWDAINDPLIGSLIDSDRRKYKMGKFKTYILLGACGLLIAGALVFLPLPESIRLSQETFHVVLKSTVFVLAYVIWDAFYTVANVPYGSMLSLVSDDKGEQAQLSTWRSIGSMIGNIVPTLVLPLLIWQKLTYDGSGKIPMLDGTYHADPDGNAYKIGDQMVNPLTGEGAEILLGQRVFWAALIMGVLGFIAFIFMIKKITIRVDENTVKTNENGENVNIFKAFGKFMRNRPAVGATVAAMGMFLGMQSASTANTIMFATYFGMPKLATYAMAIGFMPMIMFVPFIKKIVEKYGKKEASVVGTLLSVAGGIIMIFFPMLENKIAGLVVYIIGLVVFGIGLGIYNCVSWAMMGDAIDYNEWKFGTREEGTVYSLHSFFRKLSQGAGASGVLFLMGWLGYKSELGIIGQTPKTIHNMCWLVAGLYLFSAIVQFIGLALIYNLDKKTLTKMSKDLKRDVEADDIFVTATADDHIAPIH